MTITLATLAQATEQQIFDQVARHLLKQGQRAVVEGGTCKYRHNGLMCAAGCLISDDEYSENMDISGSWGRLVEAGWVTTEHADFVYALQKMHDADLGFYGHYKKLGPVDDRKGVNFAARLERFVHMHNNRSGTTPLVFDLEKLSAPEVITLATLKDATAQQVFDQIATHLLKQGVKATNEDGRCRYRGKNDTMCAAGCLIADSEYHPEMDTGGKTWSTMVSLGYTEGNTNHLALITRLQKLHDTVHPRLWVDELRNTANDYTLSAAVVDAFIAQKDAPITLATLKDATAQQVFDQVSAHLLKQGQRSLNEDGRCRYRGVNGLMCAAGCLIADSEYSPDMDANQIGGMPWSQLIDGDYTTDDHSRLIGQLQDIHDHTLPMFWVLDLAKLAIEHNLNTGVVSAHALKGEQA